MLNSTVSLSSKHNGLAAKSKTVQELYDELTGDLVTSQKQNNILDLEFSISEAAGSTVIETEPIESTDLLHKIQ